MVWQIQRTESFDKWWKKGGFRLVIILDLEEGAILLQGIFRRNNLGYKGQAGKYDEAYENLVKDLAGQFIQIKS